jgi:hypothetical protein
MVGKSALLGWPAAAALQGTLAATASLMIAFAPPEVGRTWLIPLDGKPISQAVIEKSTLTPLSKGPLPGSLIVEGRGRVLATYLFDRGILMLAAPAVICGGASPQGVEGHG